MHRYGQAFPDSRDAESARVVADVRQHIRVGLTSIAIGGSVAPGWRSPITATEGTPPYARAWGGAGVGDRVRVHSS